MSREVHRVPLAWRHPMEWRMEWDKDYGYSRMQLVLKPLLAFPYAQAVHDWELEREDILNHTGFDWTFGVEYHVTGYKGQNDTEPTTHPFDDGTIVRNEAHLQELLLRRHDEQRPDPDDYMPDFSDQDPETLGWCMYETTSEGTPISPVMKTPEDLARWLVDAHASAFARQTASYDAWMSTITNGWAPSAVFAPGRGLISGVEATL